MTEAAEASVFSRKFVDKTRAHHERWLRNSHLSLTRKGGALHSIFVGMGGLLERLHEFRALTGKGLQVFLGLVGEFRELDAETVAFAIAHQADGANLSVLDIDGQLDSSTRRDVARALDEAAA